MHAHARTESHAWPIFLAAKREDFAQRWRVAENRPKLCSVHLVHKDLPGRNPDELVGYFEYSHGVPKDLPRGYPMSTRGYSEYTCGTLSTHMGSLRTCRGDTR